jgi:hypothetical protein
MPFWKRRQEQSMLPPDIARRLDAYGRCEFDVHHTGVARGVDSTDVGLILADLYPMAQSNPEAFLAELAKVALPVGGWVVYGASRLVSELLDNGFELPIAESILSASLEFLRGLGVPRARIRPYEWSFWTARHPYPELWITPRSGYDPTATVSDLQPGELRKVAQLQPETASNVIYVRRREDGDYVAVVDAPHDVDSPKHGQRGQFEWQQAANLVELYAWIGNALETLPYWCDRELEPYIPLARPRIPIS